MCEKLRNSRSVYIYGAGRNARIVAEYFKKTNIVFKSFIVSSGEETRKSPDDEHEIIKIEELRSKTEADIFIALILRNALDVMPYMFDVPKDKIFI